MDGNGAIDSKSACIKNFRIFFVISFQGFDEITKKKIWLRDEVLRLSILKCGGQGFESWWAFRQYVYKNFLA